MDTQEDRRPVAASVGRGGPGLEMSLVSRLREL